MVIEDVDDYDQAVASGNTDGASLLTSWNAPTQNAAHARIIRTVTTSPEGADPEPSAETGAPRMRARAAKHDEAVVEGPIGGDSSDDEGGMGDVGGMGSVGAGEPAHVNAPGMVSSNPTSNTGVMGMFRPRTPHAVMDLD